MQGKYKIITLCGSLRFKQNFLEMQDILTRQGYIVLSVPIYEHHRNDEEWDDENNEFFKAELDAMHLAKIDMSDEVFIINNGGYIGKSTEQALAYAKATNKVIHSLEPLKKEEIPTLYPVKGLVKELTYKVISDISNSDNQPVGEVIDEFFEDASSYGEMMYNEAHEKD